MKISIRELKKSFLEKLSNDNFNDQRDYFNFYKSENSNLANQLEVEGYLCLHRRNYKNILVDETDWIYIEFLNSNSKDNSNVCSSHYLSRFVLKSFNLFYEYFVFKTKNNNKKCDKYFLYIQTDLFSSEIKKLNWSEIESIQINCEESRIFFLITQELVTAFTWDEKSNKVSNDKAKNNQTTKYTDQEFCYIFRILNKGPVHSLANSQFKSKLRCDVCIEIAPFVEKHKFLFYINILHSNKTYLLKTEKELEVFKMKKSSSYQAEPALIFFQNSFKIIEEFTNAWNLSNFFGVTNSPKSDPLQGDFLNSMKATLIEKKLVPSFFQPENDFDDILTKHYDLILPNKQLKLVVKTLDTNETVSIFFDTRFSVFPICILPGIEIEITDLIRKGDGVFKSNSALKPLSPQSFDLLNPKNEFISTANENPTKKKLLNDICYFKILNSAKNSVATLSKYMTKMQNLLKFNKFISTTTDKKMDLEFSTCLLVDDHSSIY
ncbi:hypothetical protein BpHYR1_027695 [Brachionus plicatilis]|uniref:Uncharacterized protein n=1 Tax=Brachionus plicatilis TaxID=10195 RepID=A0A3M7P4N9_BRAPC|nr:hypothetical protein BpHYR1_027695 [Brachionus plicatilis]